MNINKTEKIKACVVFLFLSLIILIVGMIIFKYEIEGEQNMPFILSKVFVISTAEGEQNVDAQEKWNLKIYQNNDVYFTIEKNDDYKEEAFIENIKIANIQIIKEPNVGKIKMYMPNSSDGRVFTYSEDMILEGNTLTYKGSSKTDTKKLEIGNQGGTIIIRFSNNELGDYISEDDEEIKHDGTMLTKININEEDIKFKVSFDLIIEVKGKSYKTKIDLDMPTGNIIENGTESLEIENNQKFIFKRM